MFQKSFLPIVNIIIELKEKTTKYNKHLESLNTVDTKEEIKILEAI